MIKTKPKVCSGCGKVTDRLWRSTPKLCKPCAMKADATGNKKELVYGMIKVTTKSISPVSIKQASRLKLYRIARDEYFKEKPVCEYPGCTSTKITLHHGAGRIGDLLFDKRYFKSLCMHHHEWAESHPEEAKELKLSFDRLDK